jgi:hypothetical protein
MTGNENESINLFTHVASIVNPMAKTIIMDMITRVIRPHSYSTGNDCTFIKNIRNAIAANDAQVAHAAPIAP